MAWSLVAVAAVLLVTELAVMRILPALGLYGVWEDLADSLLLTALVLGPMYLLGFRTSALSGNGVGRPDRLFRTFVLASIVAVPAICLLVGLSTRHDQKSNVIAEAEDDAIELATALRDCEVKELVLRGGGRAGLAIAPEEIPKLDRELRAFLAPFHIVKIKIFDRQTRIIYSTDRKIVGKLNHDNPMLRTSLDGLAISKLEAKGSLVDLAEEKRFGVDVVETYVPIVGPEGKVLGSFEIYRDVTEEFEVARASWLGFLVTLCVVLCGVFAGLSAIMERAARIMRSRGVALEQSRDELLKANALLENQTARASEMADQAAKASAAKSEFLANMSHEIRTPMTAVLGFAETLLDPDLSDSQKFEAVHTVRRSGEHLLQIINDILDISKIEAGKLEVEHIRCSPIQVVADVKSLMQVRADSKGLRFALEYVGAIPETIESDPTRLRQILVNLAGNAVKFTETGGVRLITRFVDDGGEPKMQFDVLDTGLGMAEEQMSDLFQAFTQADASTTRQFGGTGLGLTISKHLAEMLGGTVTVESKLGEGSLFRATVTTGSLDGVKMIEDPRCATLRDTEGTAGSSPRGTTQAEASGSSTLDCRILLVEDGPDNQRLISFVLKKAGADVSVEENGKLAVDAALAARDEGNPFDIILMDMQMPIMDGYEATSLLRQKGYTAPIIALTAHAMASDREKCIEAGCDDYATKPIDRKKLIDMIQEWRKNRPVLVPERASRTAAQEEADAFVP